MMIDFDAPEHVRRRRLVSAGFTPRRVRAMEDHVRAICDRVIDTVCERGECDFVTEIAAPLPLAVIGDMLGVDEADRRRPAALVRGDARAPRRRPTPEVIEAAARAFVEYTAYMDPVIETRRTSGRDDDLVGVLVNAGEGDDRLDHDSLDPRDPAHPGGRGRDHPPRHHRRHARPRRPTPTSWPGCAEDPSLAAGRRSRRCCAG